MLFRQLKFKWFGYDLQVLHGHRIRQTGRPFEFLIDATKRQGFQSDLSGAIQRSKFSVVASVIDKRMFVGQVQPVLNPYVVALGYCMDELWKLLKARNQQDRTTRIVMESRSKRQDTEVRTAFRRIRHGLARWDAMEGLELVLVAKRLNSIGLQVADLAAYPIGRHILAPAQFNRAWEIVSPKLPRLPRVLHEELESRILMALPRGENGGS